MVAGKTYLQLGVLERTAHGLGVIVGSDEDDDHDVGGGGQVLFSSDPRAHVDHISEFIIIAPPP